MKFFSVIASSVITGASFITGSTVQAFGQWPTRDFYSARAVAVSTRSAIPQFPASIPEFYRVPGRDFWNNPVSERGQVRTFGDGEWQSIHEFPNTMNGCNNGVFLLRWRSSNGPVLSAVGTSFSADENQTAIGTVASSDADGDDITYSISGSEIAIDSSSGVITFVSDPDYEAKTSYTATVTSSDGTNSTTQDITVSINNLNDNSPIFTSDATFSAAENQTAIGTAAVTDADGDSISFSVSEYFLSLQPNVKVFKFLTFISFKLL